MVRGVEKFKEYFRDYAGQYTFIGGTACDIILFKIKAWLDLSERREDVEIFMDKVKNEPIDLKNLNLRNVTFDEVMNSIKECYGLYYL